MPPRRRDPYTIAGPAPVVADARGAAYYYPEILEESVHWIKLTAAPPPFGYFAGPGLGGETFALPMPKGMTFADQHVYDNITLSNLAGSAMGSVKGIASKRLPLVGGIIDTIDAAAGLIGDAAKLGGYPVGSAIEVAYSNTLQRSFIFNFQLTPRTPEEATDIKLLVRALRYYAAPYPVIAPLGIWVWGAPWRFGIEFYYNEAVNEFIPKISDCAIESIEVDYDYFSGQTWSAFDGGSPIGTNLTIRFKEFEVPNKLKILAEDVGGGAF